MRISGLQKLTLLDYPGLLACTVFTPGCNFRCPFCHNSSLVTEAGNAPEIPVEEVLSFLRKRHGKLDGVCITGGEPMLQEGLEDFIVRIKAMGYKVKIDTNGSFPERLSDMIDKELIDYVAMDVKNSLEKYQLTAGNPDLDLDSIRKSIELLKKGKVGYEFRTTAVKEFHDADDFAEIADLIRGTKAYFIQNFVDSGAVIGKGLHGFGKEELEKFRETVIRKNVPCELRGVE